jgi:hypothetical protein
MWLNTQAQGIAGAVLTDHEHNDHAPRSRLYGSFARVAGLSDALHANGHA